MTHPIGIFDSGYGGLSVFKHIKKQLPQYDYIYLGDTARAPYGDRSFQTIYDYTLQAVQKLFHLGCPLVILACNTASAKALRTIQQHDLAGMAPGNRVLGVIRPTAEYIGSQTHTGKVGILGTKGTVTSQSYLIEIRKFFPDVQVFQQACPLWVPLIENKEVHSKGLDYFVKKDVQALFAQQADIDIVVMACTHYPLIQDTIIKYLPPHVRLIGQGPLVADRLQDYLNRHPEMEQRLTQNSTRTYLTTGDAGDFSRNGSFFLGEPFTAAPVILSSC